MSVADIHGYLASTVNPSIAPIPNAIVRIGIDLGTKRNRSSVANAKSSMGGVALLAALVAERLGQESPMARRRSLKARQAAWMRGIRGMAVPRKKKIKIPPLFNPDTVEMFPVFPVTDQGIRLEQQIIGTSLYADKSTTALPNRFQKDTSFIAQITGRNPTYRYERQFLNDRGSLFGRSQHLFRSVTKPMILDIRAHERDYYLLRTDHLDNGASAPLKLERISRDTVDSLLEADAIGKLVQQNPFTLARSTNLSDTPEIRERLQNMNAVTSAYNRALARLPFQWVEWYRRIQQEHLEVRANPPPSIEERRPGRLIGPFVVDDSAQSQYIARMLSPIIEDYPPAREHKQKPKKSDLPPILTAGKRRINLKELK